MTFKADGQFFYFIISLASGYLCGLITFPFEYYAVIKNKILKFSGAILRGGALAVIYVLIKAHFRFPDLEIYFIAAFLCGFLLYKKTFALIVAFYAEKIYNKCIKILKHRRKRINGTGQKKKLNRRNHCVNGIAVVHSRRSMAFSVSEHNQQKSKNRRLKKADRGTHRRTESTDRRYRSLG